MASGRQVEYRLKLNSNASSVLNADSAAANKFDNSMWQVQKTLASFGLGLGAHFLIDAAKSWTQAAADYEVAMLRIKNASEDGFGIFNQSFLNKEVDYFKIKLEEAKDSYGKFLFFVKNTPFNNDQKNQLFENLNIVGKVGGISQENMDATMNNVSKLLTEGILEGRTLRNLSRVHPGVVPFLAEELGMKSGQKDEFSKIFKDEKIDEETMVQKLSLLISGGKLTKMALPSSVLFDAIQKYADSLKEKLPETLETVQSHLNSLSNTWYRFKNSLVLGQKPELLQFFQDLEKGIHWLVNHEEQIIKTAKGIFHLVEMYSLWRISLLALQTPMAIIGFFANEQQRLNNVLGLGKEKIDEQIIANDVLVESDTNILNIQKTKIESDLKEQSAITEKTVSLDLFTDAQLANIAATEKLIEVENQLAWNEGTLFRGFGYGVGNATSSGVNKYKSVTEDPILAFEAEQLALRGNLTLVEASTAQALLFSKAEMDLTVGVDSLTSATVAYNEQLAIQNEQLLVQKDLMMSGIVSSATNQSIGLAGASLGTMGLGSSIASGASKFIMPVFIAGMAIEVANSLFPTNKVTREGLGMKEWANTFLSFGTDIFGDGKNIQGYFARQGINKAFQEIINKELPRYTSGSVLDFMSGKEPRQFKLDPKGNQLFNLLSDFSKNPEAIALGYNLLDLIDKKDTHGKRKTSNEELYSLLESAGFNIPEYLADLTNKSFGNSTQPTSKKINIPDDKTKSLRGNSSNYFTVNIHGGVNGMVNPVFKDVDGATMQDVKQMVGVEITRNMLEIINDIQVVRNGH